MSLKDQVRASMAWKKSDEICASKLKIDIDYYRLLKESIKNSPVKKDRITEDKILEFEEDLDKGTARFKGVSTKEPKSAEDIERILRIDKGKWKLSSYWNKESGEGWTISALVSRVVPDATTELKKILDEFKFKYTPIKAPISNPSHSEKSCAVLSLQDIHIGKATLQSLDIETIVKNCVTSLITRAYHSNNLDRIIWVIGGDLLNADTWAGETTAGTPVASSMTAHEMYRMGFELNFWAINYLKQFCNQLDIVFVAGNHDRLSSCNIAYALSRCISDPKINWDIEYSERKVIVYGSNMLCFEHGDASLNRSLGTFATEFAQEWGQCVERVLYTGHTHREKKIEYVTADEVHGFTLKVLPSLSGTDRWHSQNKFVGNKRAGIVDLYSISKGHTGSFTYID